MGGPQSTPKLTNTTWTFQYCIKDCQINPFKQPAWSNSSITWPATNCPLDVKSLVAAKNKRRRKAMSHLPPSLPPCLQIAELSWFGQPSLFPRSSSASSSINPLIYMLNPQLLRWKQCQQPRASIICKTSKNSPNTTPWTQTYAVNILEHLGQNCCSC